MLDWLVKSFAIFGIQGQTWMLVALAIILIALRSHGGGDGRWAMQDKITELLDPTPELSDDTPISRVRFPTRIHNVLAVTGLKTVGAVREASDAMLVSLPDLGPRSVAHLRKTLGLSSRSGTN